MLKKPKMAMIVTRPAEYNKAHLVKYFKQS